MVYQRSCFSDLANSGKAFSRLPHPLPGPPRELNAHVAAPALPPWMLGERNPLVPHLPRPLRPQSPPCPALGAAPPPPCCGRDPSRALSPRVALLVARGQRCDVARPALRTGGARSAVEPPGPPLPCPVRPCQRSAPARAALRWAGHGAATAAQRRPSPFLVRQRQPPTEEKFPAERQDRSGLSPAPLPRRRDGTILPQPRPVHVPSPPCRGCRSPSCTAWKGLLASMSLME